jgi:hypothetical protein
MFNKITKSVGLGVFLIFSAVNVISCIGIDPITLGCEKDADCRVGEGCNVSIGGCEKLRLWGLGRPCPNGRVDCPHHLICAGTQECAVPLCFFDYQCVSNELYGSGYICSNGVCLRNKGCN